MGSTSIFVHVYAHSFFLSPSSVKPPVTLNIPGYRLVTPEEWDAQRFQEFTQVSAGLLEQDVSPAVALCVALRGSCCPVASDSTVARQGQESCVGLGGCRGSEADTGEHAVGQVTWQVVELGELVLLGILGQLVKSILAAVLTVRGL